MACSDFWPPSGCKPVATGNITETASRYMAVTARRIFLDRFCDTERRQGGNAEWVSRSCAHGTAEEPFARCRWGPTVAELLEGCSWIGLLRTLRACLSVPWPFALRYKSSRPAMPHPSGEISHVRHHRHYRRDGD